MGDKPRLPRAVRSYYEQFDERERLDAGPGQIEFVRTQEILRRLLPPPPAVILDVGGAAGRYACWLAREGYEVHLVDPVARLVEQAREASASQLDAQITSCTVGDARSLDFDAATADALLLFGPLYHLVEIEDRLAALREALRVLRPGGLLCAVGISRFASAIDGMVRGFLQDPQFVQIVEDDLRDGRHRNPTGNIHYFTEAYFHHPDELRAEVEQVGFEFRQTLAIDGVGGMVLELERYWREKTLRERILEVLRKLEAEPALIGASPHIMAVARKPR
jgi:ubiquinone/menaquinone biosynthesis C-methylase UbiE